MPLLLFEQACSARYVRGTLRAISSCDRQLNCVYEGQVETLQTLSAMRRQSSYFARTLVTDGPPRQMKKKTIHLYTSHKTYQGIVPLLVARNVNPRVDLDMNIKYLTSKRVHIPRMIGMFVTCPSVGMVRRVARTLFFEKGFRV